MSPYAINDNGTTQNLISVTPGVSSTTPNNGEITITINDIAVSPPTPALVVQRSFLVTFNSNPTSGSPLWWQNASNPFESLSPACINCLKTASPDATYVGGAPAGTVTFTYLDSFAAGLTYSALGLWAKPTDPFNSTWPDVGGAFSAGVQTRRIDLPTTGSAHYEGYFIGQYVTSVAVPFSSYNSGYAAGPYLVGANAAADAHFNTGFVTFSTSNTYIAPSGGGGGALSEARLNLSSSAMPISPTVNLFSGQVGTSDQNGFFPSTSTTPVNIQGGFYGKPNTSTGLPSSPPELGGSLSVGNGTDKAMVGSFGLIKKSSTP